MKRTTRQKAYDIWKSIESDFEGSNTKNFAESADPQKRVEHGKKIGDECVESGRIVEVSRKGGQTVTPKKKERILEHNKAKRHLTDEQVIEMKEIYRNDVSVGFPELAEKYGVDVVTIHNIMNGKTYQGIGGDVVVRIPLLKCPHCPEPPMIKTNFERFHGDKCGLKGINVQDIIDDYNKGGFSFATLGKKYGLSPSKIDKIIKNYSK